MREKKIILLSLALLLPVGIFLFLKFFGKNQFDVPPMHQDSISNVGNCTIDYRKPYLLPDSVMDFIKKGSSASLFVLNFSAGEPVLQRVWDGNEENELKVIHASSLEVVFPDMNFFKNCVLLLNTPDDVVLVDDQKRIRGYYQSSDREDIDRLLVEISIILKKY